MTMRNDLRTDNAWIQTYTGKPFWPLNPRIEDLDIEDIAHALSMQCRYSGHVKYFYSVAEHSIHISRAVSPENALWGLLHDASEAYLVDVPRPIKPHLPQYREAESVLMACIAQRYGLRWPEPTEVKAMDTRILFNEREALMSKSVREWGLTGEPIPDLEIICYPPRQAEILFLSIFRELMTIQLAPRRAMVEGD